MSMIWHNGELIEDGPVFTAHDRIRLGDGLFDTMLGVDGKLMHGRAHFEKLLRNSQILFQDWDKPGIDVLMEAAENLIQKNGLDQGRTGINTILTRGESAQGLKIPENPNIQMVMRATKLPDEFPPVKAIIAGTVRRNEGSPLSQIKNCNYGDNILAVIEANAKGANEAIMLNNAGHVACSTTANIFIVKNGELVTPPLSDGAQNGLVRKFVLERYSAKEESFAAEDLRGADGVYVTNSLRGAVAVETLDGKTLPAPRLQIDKDIHLE